MESVRCGVCSDVYDVGAHDPLVLPCGHTFCRECLVSLCKGCRIECPACRRKHNILSVGFLPKNFALLSLSTANYSPSVCQVHGDPLRFWCTDCKVEVCGICMFEGHARDVHRVVRIKTLLDEKKKSIEAEAHQLILLTKREARTQEKCYSRYEKKLLRLLKTNRDVCYLHGQVKKVLHGAMESMCVKDILENESSLKKLHANTQKVIASSRLICANRKYSDEIESESVPKTTQIQSEEFPKPLALNLRCLNGRNGKLQWDRDRLLLFAALPGEPSASMSGIQMIAAISPLPSSDNSEVFLELAFGEVVLGKVYIHLWSHLRRAQHFLALCTGTFGPSFKGSLLMAVKRRNEPEESVAGGDYLTPEGMMTCRALMTDLEWGGVYAGERKEGLVVGSSGGFMDEDARFGISTSRFASGQCQCPFGEVIEGLDVVRKTLSFDHVNQVMIKECGMVVLHHP